MLIIINDKLIKEFILAHIWEVSIIYQETRSRVVDSLQHQNPRKSSSIKNIVLNIFK